MRGEIQRIHSESFGGVYGAEKVWRQLLREDFAVARCTVEHLMRQMGLRGAVRGRAFKITTISDPLGARPSDPVQREFHATRPQSALGCGYNARRTWADFAYVAFVIDVFSRCIVGWRVSSSLHREHSDFYATIA